MKDSFEKTARFVSLWLRIPLVVLHFSFLFFFCAIVSAADKDENGPWKDYQRNSSSKVAIDPAKVGWDDTVQEEVIDPAKVVWDRDREYSTYNMTKKDRRKVYDAFAGDPLAFIADEYERQYVTALTDKMPDRDEFRKRMALAAYFTVKQPKSDFRVNLANLDKILEKFFEKKVSIDEAFDRVTVLCGYSPQKIKMQKRMEFLRKNFPVELFLFLIFLGAVLGFVVWIVKFIRKRRRKIIDFIKLCFLPENFFQTSILIIGSVIALSLICIALKMCF